MIRRRVVFAPEARDDLFELYDWIAATAGSRVAISYVERIEAYCLGFDIAGSQAPAWEPSPEAPASRPSTLTTQKRNHARKPLPRPMRPVPTLPDSNGKPLAAVVYPHGNREHRAGFLALFTTGSGGSYAPKAGLHSSKSRETGLCGSSGTLALFQCA